MEQKYGFTPSANVGKPSQVTQLTTLICDTCSVRNLPGASTCKNCGDLLLTDAEVASFHINSSICPRCGFENRPGAKFCKQDGCALPVIPNVVVSESTSMATMEIQKPFAAEKPVAVCQAPMPPLGTTLCQYAGHTGSIRSLAWSPDGKWIVSTGDDGTAQIWDAATGKPLLIYQGHLNTQHQSVGWQAPKCQAVRAIVWSPNGQYIASAGGYTTVQVWNASNGNHLFTYEGHRGRVDVLAWSPDNTFIASGGEDRTIQVWPALRGRRLFTIPGQISKQGAFQQDMVSGLAWSPDGASIAATYWNNEAYSSEITYSIIVSAWKATNGEAYTESTPGGDEYPTSIRSRINMNSAIDFMPPVGWSPDGRYIAYSGGRMSGGWGGSVYIHKWASKFAEQVLEYQDHISCILALAWSPNGKRLASAGADASILTWDALTGLNVDTKRGSTAIAAVAWSPDSQRLAASLDGKTIQVWQAE